jgi:hypothetical protein
MKQAQNEFKHEVKVAAILYDLDLNNMEDLGRAVILSKKIPQASKN